MQTVGIFSNTNTNIQKQCTTITSNTAMASSFISKISIRFYGSNKSFISELFWKVTSFLKMMSSWHHNPPKIYYEVIIQEKMKKHNHYEQNSIWAKFGKKTTCTVDVMQKTEKITCIQIADVSSTRRNCNISVSTQGIDFKFSANLKN